MKTRQLTRLLFSATFAMATFVSSAVFAQVKIGTNPTTIGANSNLEVEAANNKKVIVDKNVGTVRIDNLPTGAATDSLVSWDPATGILRKIDKVNLLRILGLSGSAKLNAGGQALGQTENGVDFSSVTYDEEGGADLVNNVFVVKVAGFYTVLGEATVQIPLAGPEGATGSFTITLNGGNGAIYTSPNIPRGFSGTGQVINVRQYFNVGDTISLLVRPCAGCSVGNAGYTMTQAHLTIQRDR